MTVTTYTWTATTAGTTITDSWTNPPDWGAAPGGAFPTGTVPTAASFSNGSTTSYFEIQGSATLDLTNFGNSQSINGLTVDDANATLVFGGSPIAIGDIQLFAGTMQTGQDNGSLIVGLGGGGGTFLVGAGAVLQGGGSAGPGPGYTIDGNGAVGTQLTGSGQIDATGGLLAFGANLTITSTGGVPTFDIGDNTANQAYLAFEGDVDSGVVNFLANTANSGVLVLANSQTGDGSDFVNNGVFGASISGLAVSTDTTMLNGLDIEVASVASGTVVANGANSILKLTDTDNNVYSFNLNGNYVGDLVQIKADTSSVGGTDVFLMSVCYAAGTSVQTPDGDVSVETIQPGDSVMTLVDGALVPQAVKWVGHRDLVLSMHPNPDMIAPVRIARGALGDNLPTRDLVLSPDHCLFIDGALFPAKLLVNDMTITRDLTVKTVSYHHIELDRHAVMIAEGVAAETYLDTGNRAFFSNAGMATVLHPELTINENLRCWETDACAPLTVKPELVKPVWQRFADRARELGHTAPVHATTSDAAVHLMVNGKMVRPVATSGKTLSFMVPGNARSVRLVSRAARPNTLTPWLDDPRMLGVAIRSVTLRDSANEAVFAADHPALRDGWHAVERADDGAFWRWSAGDAVLPITTSGPCVLEVDVSATSTYIESSLAA